MAKSTKTAAKLPKVARPKTIALNMLDGAGGGLANLFTGMNMETGRRGGDTFYYMETPPEQLEAMYRSDWMSRKAVDIIADDMTQEWRRWNADSDLVDAIETAEKELQIVAKVRQALKLSRLYGGAAIIVGDGRPTMEPIEIEGMSEGGLEYAFVAPSARLQVEGDMNWNPSAENFGQPNFYNFTPPQGTPTKIHWSRVHRFIGNPYPDPMAENDPWGDSILDVMYNAIRDAGIALSSGATALEEAKVDIVTMQNLESYLSETQALAKLQQRMALLKMGKSMHRILLMGGNETYDSKSFPLTNVDNVLSFFLQVVSGAIDIPATRFLSQSPAGMDATGESDLRNYGTTIQAMQERNLRPSMDRLDQMMWMHALGEVPEEVRFEYASIWRPTPKEKAETNKAQAEADLSYANSGMIPTAALEKSIQARLIDSGDYPQLDRFLAELTASELDAKRPEPAAIPIDPNAQAALAAKTAAPAAGARPGAKPKPKPKNKPGARK